jgi:hypothetical protein
VPHNSRQPIPLAADQLLASKRNRELLASYDQRAAGAVLYMQLVNPGVQVIAGPLTDPKVHIEARLS